MKRALPFASALLLLALLLAAWIESRRIAPVALTPALTGEVEYCITCHADVPDISAAHPNSAFGCVRCHGGERLALNADLAHSTLRGGNNPSAFSVVEESCGGPACHSGAVADERDHIQRVLTSVQATYAGAIAQVRYAFGAQTDPAAHLGIYAVQDADITTATGLSALAAFNPTQETSPAVQTFAANCLNCHLGAEPLPGAEYARLTGCAACHSPLPEGDAIAHQLTTAIPYTQCNTCHNRGNYSMRDMAFHPRTDAPTDRLHDYYQPIGQYTQCEWELDCVDCHTRSEGMGDGDLHSNKFEIQYVQCQTCHGTLAAPPLTATVAAESIALRLAYLNPVLNLKTGDTIMVTEKGEPLWNIRQQSNGTFALTGKATGQTYTVPLVQGSACTQKPDEQESRYCHECHAVQR